VKCGWGFSIKSHVNLLQELLPPPSYSDLSTAKFDPTPACPSIEIKEITSIESLGRCTEMQQYQENFEIIETVSEEIMEDKKQVTLGSVGIIGLGNMEFELPLMTQEKPMEKSVISVECCKENRGCSEAIGEVMAMLDGPVTVVNEASSSIPEFQSPESGDFMKLASPIYLQEDKDEENVSMDMEDKGIVVNENTPPSVATSGCSKFVSSGLAEGHNSRPMLKRVMCKRDVKFPRTKKMNSSQHLLQETMTKKLKNSYSKASDAQKVAKAVKCTHLSKTSIKRHHTDMESTDSGSSQGENHFCPKTMLCLGVCFALFLGLELSNQARHGTAFSLVKKSFAELWMASNKGSLV
jgi:hypothetical protein